RGHHKHPQRGLPPQMVVWDEPSFQGRKREFTAACDSTAECGFSTVRSFKIESGAWAGFEHSGFQGQQFVLERGEYPCWEAWSGSNAYHVPRMGSFRPIACAVTRLGTEWHGTAWPGTARHGTVWPGRAQRGQRCAALLRSWVGSQYPGYRGFQYILESDSHAGRYPHVRHWGSHAQTGQIQSLRRVQH
ncbi:CRBA4 protein, partial [Nothoprocta ornata]|nr:CRBA4 protein [Nothoprocta ornata]